MRLQDVIALSVLFVAAVSQADSRQDKAKTVVAQVLPKEAWDLEVALSTEEYVKIWSAKFPAYASNVKVYTDRLKALFPYRWGKEVVAGLYAKYFDESELDDLIRLFRTPLGQKLLNIMPEIDRERVRIGQTRIAEHYEELVRGLRAPTETTTRPQSR